MTRDPAYSFMSRSSSSYSVAPSFISDFQDTDSLLPDLSDTVRSGKVNSSESVGLPDKDPRLADIQSETRESRTRSYSGNTTNAPPRPRTLGLLKRNSDLPGRVQRVDDMSAGFFPIGMKKSTSDTNLNKDPYAIEEEVSFVAISGVENSPESAVDGSVTDELASTEKDSAIGKEKDLIINEPVAITRIDITEVPAPVEGGVSQKDATSKGALSPVHSPTKEKQKSNLSSPRTIEPPPVSKKPARSPSVEKKDFVPSEKPMTEEAVSAPTVPMEVASRELIVPVMTALQERRASTPDCSTAQASNDTQVSDRVQSPGESPSEEMKVSVGDGKTSEAKPTTRSAYTSRVSVKDRLQQYEKNRSGSLDSGRKPPSELFNPNPVASRKQMWEQKERGLYKRVSDMGMRKPRSDSGSGSSTASGSPKLSRKRLNDSEDGSSALGVTSPVSGSPLLRRRLNDSVDGNSAVQSSPEKTKPVEQDKQGEPKRRYRKDKSEKTERPRSLVLDNLDKRDAFKLDLHDVDKETLSPRELDIPLDHEDINDRHRPRRSPNTSPRNSRANVRSPFPDVSNEEEREPQFV